MFTRVKKAVYKRPKQCVILTTPRLIIREIVEADFGALMEIMQDDVTMAVYGGGFSKAECKDWFRKQFRRYKEDGVGLWSVILEETGEIIGQCGIMLQILNGTSELCLGYFFNKKHWHNGYATEATIACRQFAFSELGASAMYAFVPVGNFISQRVAINCGMSERSILSKRYKDTIMQVHVYYMGSEDCAAGS